MSDQAKPRVRARSVGSTPAMEAMIQRVLESQQPFWTSLVNQLGVIEQRVATIDAQTKETAKAVSEGKLAEVFPVIRDLTSRIEALERDKTKFIGAKELLVWAPRLFFYIAISVMVLYAYLKNGGKLP